MSGERGFGACPVPRAQNEYVQLAHGGGGLASSRLVDRLIVPAFRNAALEDLGDGAVIDVAGGRLAFSTDSFVVRPAFFPGGDIGSLAIHGTCNDLAMCGAEPLFLGAGLILEEGFAMADLETVIESMARSCAQIGVPLVTGDTKVVERGRGDGIYINTSGVGRVREGVTLSPRGARPGDVVLVSGPVGDHGIAVMAAREGIELETQLVSDSAHVGPQVVALLDAVPTTRVLRDPTRGGLATALVEIALASAVGIRIDEAAIPIRGEVQAACALLGFDPLYVACEGRFLAIVPAGEERRAVEAIASVKGGDGTQIIGEVGGEPGRLVLRTRLRSHRILDRLSGDQLPRIC